MFDIVQQVAFYGAYHSNPVNVRIHIVCVPILLWFVVTRLSIHRCFFVKKNLFFSRSGIVMYSFIPIAKYLPIINYDLFDYTLTPYLVFKLNASSILIISFQLYYFVLEPLAAVSHPSFFLLLLIFDAHVVFAADLSATSYTYAPHRDSLLYMFLVA
jgi:2-hydroxy fatty acid dioxygenase